MRIDSGSVCAGKLHGSKIASLAPRSCTLTAQNARAGGGSRRGRARAGEEGGAEDDEDDGGEAGKRDGTGRGTGHPEPGGIIVSIVEAVFCIRTISMVVPGGKAAGGWSGTRVRP
jgi:hypothetical protein